MQRLAEVFVLPAGPGDALELARLHVRSWRETYQGLLPQAFLESMSVARHRMRFAAQLRRPAPAGEIVLAAESREGLVGYCAGAERAGEAEISTLYLLRQAQGRGLGRGLLAAMARALEARGAASLALWVLQGNRAAFGFYAHLGGRPDAERPVRIWGAALSETRFRWDDIGRLAGG